MAPVDHALGAPNPEGNSRKTSSGDTTVGHAAKPSPVLIRLREITAATYFHELELDIRNFAAEPDVSSRSPATLSHWLNGQGTVVKGIPIKWCYLVRVSSSPRIVLMLRGSMVCDSHPPIPVDEMRLTQVWAGDILLIKRRRDQREALCRLSGAESSYQKTRFRKSVASLKFGDDAVVFTIAKLSMGSVSSVLNSQSPRSPELGTDFLSRSPTDRPLYPSWRSFILPFVPLYAGHGGYSRRQAGSHATHTE